MAILYEPRFLQVEDAEFLSVAVNETCEQVGVGKGDKDNRVIIAARVAELVRSGMRDIPAIKERVIAEARALSSIAA